MKKKKHITTNGFLKSFLELLPSILKFIMQIIEANL
jgi:hypothetical protein